MPSITPNGRNGVADFQNQAGPGSAGSQNSTSTATLTSQTAPTKKPMYFIDALSTRHQERIILPRQDEESFLMPAYKPPKYRIYDLFPFSLIVRCLSEREKDLKGKKAARVRAQLKQHTTSHNLPLELTLYLVRRLQINQCEAGLKLFRAHTLLLFKHVDVSMARPQVSRTLFLWLIGTDAFQGNLLNALNHLEDSLTALERILSTPIPFSFVRIISPGRPTNAVCYRYSIHLWTVAGLYCLLIVCFHDVNDIMKLTLSLSSRSRSGKPSVGLQSPLQFLWWAFPSLRPLTTHSLHSRALFTLAS